MIEEVSFFKKYDSNYQNYTLSDFIEEVNNLLDYAQFTDRQILKLKTNKEIDILQFYELWHEFTSQYFHWSAKLNHEIRKRIANHRKSNLLKFQKYCYLYQYWWITFHLITKCFSNFNRDKIREFENVYLKKIEVINNRLESNELIDRFEQENFDYLKELEKMN